MRLEPTISEPKRQIDWNARAPFMERPPDRPLVLGIAAVLLIASGIVASFVLVVSWSDLSAVGDEVGMGAEWPYVLAALAAVSLFSGLLVFSGEPLGWYLAILLLANSFLAAIQGIFTARDYGVPVALMDGDTISWYTKYGARALLSLLLVFYFFTGRVRRFCSVPLWKGLICTVLCAVLGVAAVIVTLV